MTVAELTEAIEGHDLEMVKEALRLHPSLVSARTAAGDTPLHIACWQKQLAIVEALLDHQLDVNACGWQGRTPLHYAVHDGRAVSVPIVRVLIEHGADPSIEDMDGFTAIASARREVWDDLDEVLELMGTARPDERANRSSLPPNSDFATVVSFSRALETTAHTQAALSRLFEAFTAADSVAMQRASHGLPSANTACVDDARRVLEALAATSWAAPARRWISGNLNAARIIELLKVYETIEEREHQ